MKKLSDMEYYKRVLNQLNELKPNFPNIAGLFGAIDPLIQKIDTKKNTLNGLKSTLKENYELAPITEDEVINALNAIRDADNILSEAKILKEYEP